MSSLLCVCDNLIDISLIPNPNGLVFFNEVEFFNWECLEDNLTESLHKILRWAVRCPNCGRIWMFNPGYGTEPELYESVPIPD